MADTAAGAALTDAHRIAQVELAQQGIAAALVLWTELNPSNLPATREQWLALLIQLIGYFDNRSAILAAGYLEQFRLIEGNPGGPIEGLKDFDRPRVIKSVDYNGPGRIVSYIKDGMNPVEAKRRAQPSLSGAIQRHVLQGGRRVVDLSSIANPQSRGFRRVADGSPCTFCAMLVTRGPAYKSERTAGEGRAYHNKCGCTVEEVFSRWQPNALELRYIDAYDAVSVQLRRERLPITAANVLPRLRAGGKFGDSPKAKPAPPTA